MASSAPISTEVEQKIKKKVRKLIDLYQKSAGGGGCCYCRRSANGCNAASKKTAASSLPD